MIAVTLHLGELPIDVEDAGRVVTLHPGQRARLQADDVPAELLPLLAARPPRCTVTRYERLGLDDGPERGDTPDLDELPVEPPERHRRPRRG